MKLPHFTSTPVPVSAALLIALWAVCSAPWAATLAHAGDDGLAESECSGEKRMDGPGGSMEHVAVRDQYNLSICWSESESEMADAIRFSRFHETNYDFQTSAVTNACGVSADRGVNAIATGGQPCWAFDYMKKHGVCSEQAVEEGTLAGTQAAISDFSDASYLSKSLQLGHSNLRNAKGCVVPGAEFPVREAAPNQSFLDAMTAKNYDVVKGFQTITRACSPTPPRITAENPFSRYNVSCEQYPSAYATHVNPAVFAHKLASLLNEPNPLPVEVDYCAAIFDEGGRKPSVDLRDSSASCKGHASLVIGRRWEGGKCQFLIRNSWGTECNHYNKAMRGNCEEGKGNIWVDSDVLTENTVRLVPPPSITPIVPAKL